MIARAKPRVMNLTLAASALLFGCGDPTGPQRAIPDPPDVRAWVTGAAANALNADGHFLFPEPSPPGSEPIISRSMSGALALGAVRTWSGMRTLVEGVHGAPIQWDQVQVEERTAYYAHAAYEPLPDTVPLPARRPYGPYYLVPLYEGGEQIANISVAAYSTDLRLDEDGEVHKPAFSGNEFLVHPVSRRLGLRLPIWPEEAVREVAQETGVRVSEVPELIAPHKDFAPQYAVWRLVLDREVEVERLETGAREPVRELYVGASPGLATEPSEEWRVWWYVPHPDQPAADTLYFSYPGEEALHSVEVRIRPGLPVKYSAVKPLK